ncbi:MAG TPA: ABC transporter permease [Vicinamibacterales bacterium]|nr:ABC transporter permease [Vicinamibacterales bacterium]
MSDTFLRDLRIGLRVLVKEKGFCTLATIVLALGICGVTTMFSVVNGVMLRGFSFPNADRLASANFVDPTSATFFGVNGQVSAMDYNELLPMQQSFELMSAYLNGSTVNVTVNGKPQRYTGAYTTEHFLRILGVAPIKGRDFEAADNQPGAEKVALIGYGIWQRDFAGAEDVVGKVVRINGKPATIIGVMPRGFAFPVNEELWIPLFSEFPPRPRNDPAAISPAVLGLLKPGVTVDQATLEFTSLARRFAEAYPETNKQFNVGQVQTLIENFTPRPLRGTLLTMLGFCVGVLLIACANVMNMQFARATLRARELAIRSSLGASRIRLVRQMLTESLLLSSIGAVLGIVLAYAATDWLSATVRNLDNPPPSWITFDLAPVVLAVTVFATIASAVVSGLLPALGSSRNRTIDVLRDSGRGNTSYRVSLLSRGLVVFQIVVTCVLLIGAMLQLQSIVRQQNIDYGYDTTGVMSARMGLMDGDYPSPEARRQFYDRLLEQMRANPEYEAVALTNRFRMVFSGDNPIEIEGAKYATEAEKPRTNFELVTGTFFDVTRQKLLDGRTFTDQDLDTRQPVAIVNAAFAKKHLGTANALGRRFRAAGNPNQTSPWRTIVGVVSTVRMSAPFNIPGVDDSGYYMPFYASPGGPTPPTPLASQFATVVVRPRGGPVEPLANSLRRDVAKLDPNLPLYFVGTPQSQILGFVAQNRIIATMFTVFGAVAVLLAAVGIYGVMSFAVNQRTQEFGVRMALGAGRGRILTMVMRQSAIQIALGLIFGLTLAMGIAMIGGAGIQSVLFGVNPRDKTIYATVFGLIAVVSLVATLVPARRATRVDPIVALRAE